MIICVIFDLGMAVIMFLFGICFVKSNGKAAAFLSGYNMKSKEERKQYDEKRNVQSIWKQDDVDGTAICSRCSHRFIIQWNRVFCSVCNMDLSICFIDERTYETRKNRKEHLGKNYMRKKIYKLSRNRIILGNKRSFNYLKEMM